MKSSGEVIGAALTTVGVAIAGALLCLSVLPWLVPEERAHLEDLAYQHTGQFAYSAGARPGTTYVSETVSTGEPIFVKLANAVTFTFSYQFLTDWYHDIRGSYRLNAIVADASGWKRTIELQTETTFVGDSFVASGEIDLSTLQAMIDGFQVETGIFRRDYEVSIVPEVSTYGSVMLLPTRDQFAPRLTFRLDPLQLQLVTTSSPGANPGDKDGTPLTPSKKGVVKWSSLEQNRLEGPGFSLAVSSARQLSLLAQGVGIAVLLSFLWISRRPRLVERPILDELATDGAAEAAVASATAVADQIGVLRRDDRRYWSFQMEG